MLRRLVDLLPRKLAKHGLTRPVLAAQIVTAWDDIAYAVCKKARGKSRALSLNARNILIVICEHPALAQELALYEGDILAAYKAQFPHLDITLRFQTGRVDQAIDMPGR